MPFSRPTLPELVERTTTDLVSRLEIQSTVLRRAIVRVFARVWSGAVYLLHGHLDWSARQQFAATADDDELDLHGQDVGVARKPGGYAAGDVVFTGTNGTIIPAETQLQRSDGLQYETLLAATVAAGTATVGVRARAEGAESNTDAGVTLTLMSPLAGVQSAATVDADGIRDGVAAEDAESYRARILDRKRNVPQGGSYNDYIRWAKEVPGVTRVWPFARWMGPGTVGVGFVLDDQADIIPGAAKVAEVQAYIDDVSRRPVTAEVIVFAPVALPIAYTIHLVPDTAAVRAAVEAELRDLHRRQGAPGAVIPLSNIVEAISLAPGEQSHDLIAPAADVVPAAHELPTFGGITWI